jgi:hypothetical protein
MSEPFYIVDPLESFAEAREAVAADIGTHCRQTRTNRVVWLSGAVFTICTLILLNSLSSQQGISSRPDTGSTSDKSSPDHVSSLQPGSDPLASIRAVPLSAHSPHAIDPHASAGGVLVSQVQAGEKPTALSFAETNSERASPVTADVDNKDAQWVEVSRAAKVHSGPSVSTPILTHYRVGTELRMIGRQNGWVQIVDPATLQQGWIYEIYLSPGKDPEQDGLPLQSLSSKSQQLTTQAELETADPSQMSAPDPSTPAAKSKKPRWYYDRHRVRGAFVIRFGFRRFRF